MEHPPIALVVALKQERQALQRVLTSLRADRVGGFRLVAGKVAGQDVLLIQAGPGRDRARRALGAASCRFPVRAAWSLGFAGGLSEALRAGDLVCPAVVLWDDGRTGQAFDAHPSQPRVLAALSAAGICSSGGPLLSVESPIRTPEAKRAAHQRTGAFAVDMEAAGVAEAAAALAIPWLAIKAVVDGVEQPLPGFLAGCTTAGGDPCWRGVLWGLAFTERRRALLRLRQASRLAAQALGRGLEMAAEAWSP